MEKSDHIWMDGKLVPWHEANVHVLTHTLHYGFGVFEGIRCYQRADKSSAIFRLKEHVDRLFGSAKILGIRVPFTPEEIENAILETVRANKLEECYIRPIIFLGDNKMGLNPAGVDVRGNPTRARIVLFRKPIERRAKDSIDLTDLLHEILVAQVATFLGVEPSVIDPTMDTDD